MFKPLQYLSAILFLSITTLSWADITVPMYFVSGENAGKEAGKVIISETPDGLQFLPVLKGMPNGNHGFHIHENPSCEQNAMAAGDHWDPKMTHSHLGPNGNGHLGDLPYLHVAANGRDVQPVIAPHLKHLDEVKNHSLMIHVGADNYSDMPQKAGGGNGRIVCGVIG